MKYMCSLLVVLTVTLFCANAQQSYNDFMLAEANKTGDTRKLSSIFRHTAGNLTDIDSAITLAQKAAAYAQKGNHENELYEAYLALTTLYESGGYFTEALEAGRQTLVLAQKLNNKRYQYYAESRTGNAFRRQALFDSALIYSMAALNTAEQHLNDTFVSKGALNVGGIYAALNDFDKAEKYMLQSLEVTLRYGDSLDAAYTYNNLGILNRDLQHFGKAMDYYRLAQELYIKHGDSSDVAFITNDIGYLYSLTGKLDSAEKYIRQAIDIRVRMKERNELAYSYYFLGENYERKGNIKLAEKYILKALSTAIEIKNNKQTFEAYESVADFYARNNIYDKAFNNLKHFISFKDSLKQSENEAIIEELNTKYQTSKKEQKIQEQEIELTKRNYLLGAAFFIVLFGGLWGYSSYRRYKLRKTTEMQQAILKQQELATKAVLEAEENERQRIASDLHDGVGQMMSAAKINLSNISEHISFASNDEKTRFDNAVKLVDDSCTEVRAVSHNIMPNALLRNSLAAAVRSFINKISEQVIKINLYTEGLNERIDENAEVMLYRVVQECINNVIKHAKANTLDISLIRDGNEISVTIEDNGIGFDTSNKKVFDGVGLKSIRSRVDYLKGTVEWDSRAGKGTVVSILIPLKA